MTRQGKRIDAVVFDLDDTLIDWSQRQGTWQAFTHPKLDNIYDYLAAAGHTLPALELFRESLDQHAQLVWEEAKQTWTGAYFGTALQRCFSELALDLDQIDLEEVMRVYAWEPVPGVVLFEDTISVLKELRQRSYKIGLVTNSFYPMWMRDVELHHYELMDYLDARVSSGDVGYLKPHPAIYEHILALLETAPERAVFVGDRPVNDIAGANEVGMISVLMQPPHLNRDLAGIEPDYTITSLSELLPVLEELEREKREER